jgi:tetratricopeptide (TPR) repeat protein
LTDSAAAPARGVERWRVASAFVASQLVFAVLLAALRVYERFLVGQAHVLPDGATAAALRGVTADLAASLSVALVLALPIAAIALRAPRAAIVAHRAALTAAAIAATLLVQYFAVTLVPLGADLFGYSLSDIKTTVMTSKGVGVAGAIPLLAVAAMMWMGAAWASRRRVPRQVVFAFGGLMLLDAAVPALLAVRPAQFAGDAAYGMAEDKLLFFGRKSKELAVALVVPQETFTGYPLMHRAPSDDVLGPRLALRGVKPNLVFVIVEGLGRDFVGPGARFGGFTPFLDSLAGQSLYWENFLSTSGRTFGVLPAILGSLPFGPGGFMDLRSAMPPHLSLVQLLRERGYTTSFYTGTDGHYDFIDTFLERQGLDRLVDQTRFGPSYEKQPAGEGNFSWGYPDDALFQRSLDDVGTPANTPRLDVYLTITTHEPFNPPRNDAYRAEFTRRLAAMTLDGGRRAEYEQYAGVFATLMYTDDAIRHFIASYRKRPEYARTIFFITGDHRIIPIPSASRLDRFHVPFFVYSPMLTAPARFASVSSHFDVTPSILAMLQHGAGMSFPDTVAWMGTGIDTATAFRNVHALPFMRTKNEIDDYLMGDRYLTGGRLFQLDSDFTVRPINDASGARVLADSLRRFRAVNLFVTRGPNLLPGLTVVGVDPAAVASEDAVWAALRLGTKTPTDAFEVARAAAFATHYDTARLITRRLLRDIPNYHDARALLARTYAWQRQFDTARTILKDLSRRSPEYPDGHVALADLERWDGKLPASLAAAQAGLGYTPRNPELLLAKARALEALGRRAEERATLDLVDRVMPANPDAAALRKRLPPGS